MNTDQCDIFGEGKSVDEVQIENAINLLSRNGYRVSRTAEEAKQIAIESGYRVSDPLIIDEKIITVKDLRNYFYKRLWDKYPNRQSYYIEGNWPRELRIFKLFIESREATGLNRFNAVQECIALIDVIFDHIEEFNFKQQVDLRILGQDKAGWITQKAVRILNEELQKEQEKNFNRRMESIEKELEDEVDLKGVSDKLDELLNKMEDNNG